MQKTSSVNPHRRVHYVHDDWRGENAENARHRGSGEPVHEGVAEHDPLRLRQLDAQEVLGGGGGQGHTSHPVTCVTPRVLAEPPTRCPPDDGCTSHDDASYHPTHSAS